MNREELERIINDFLDAHTTMTLSCSLRDEPWATAVFYARMGSDLVFFSSPDSRHSSCFAANPQAAAAVHGDYTGWQDIKGLQMAGRVERVEGVLDSARATAVYLKRYPFVRDLFSAHPAAAVEVARKVSKVVAHVFRPHRIRYLDNAAGFGAKWELVLHEDFSE